MTPMPPKEEKVDHAFYEELQAQLKEALNAKKAADKALSGVEDQIDKFEGTTRHQQLRSTDSDVASELSYRDKCKWKRRQGIRELSSRSG
jgi:hypothetical protein